jgi:hypothetical protein
MPGTLHTLNRPIGWNPYLHRATGCLRGQLRQQRADGIPQLLAAGLRAVVQRAHDRIDGGEIRVRTGHDGTIRRG